MGDDFDPGNPRRCDNKFVFPSDYRGEEHAMGTIWASLLWDLRSEPAIGRDTADTIILQSLTFLRPGNSYFEALDALIQADRVVCPSEGSRRGEHEDIIKAAFKNRQAR